jgi:predicted Ser/Thr protein kinase
MPINHRAAGRVFDELRSGDPVEVKIDDAPDLPGYVIRRKLGDGGGGAVWLASRQGAEQLLAVKILRHRFGIGGKSDRAWRELHILSQIRLPAVPRVADYGVHDGRLYIATEYIDGLSLNEYCRTNNLGRRECVELLARVADAVHSLHETGVIHRDIKPSNIIVDRNDQPVIIDLGIASLLTDDVMETLTAEGAPIGSPAFMSPEQARGSRREITTRSDVYGLGATAYLVLTGHTPHEMAETIHASVRRVAEDEPRNPRELDGSLPRDLAAVLGKAVAREPGQRYVSAAEFAEDLRRWMGGDPVTATPPGFWRRGTRWVTKHPVIATTVACTVIALAIFGSAGFVTWRLTLRPDHLEFSLDGSSVRLVTSTNVTLRAWQGLSEDSFPVAQIVKRHQKLGGGRVLVISSNKSVPGLPNGELCIYNLNDYNADPVWTSAGTIALPPRMRYAIPSSQSTDAYELTHAWIEDVFPDLPGYEIIAFHRHSPYSPTAIRIYDLTGRLLYETWHDGHLWDAYWMSGPRLIVATGCNSKGSWFDLVGIKTNDIFPTIVFAIQPLPGVTNQTLSWPGFSGTVEPAWYLCVLPPEMSNYTTKHSYISLGPPSMNLSPERFVRFSITTTTSPKCSYSWVLDAFGDTVIDYPSSGWVLDPNLPDRSLVKLGQLPFRSPAPPEP